MRVPAPAAAPDLAFPLLADLTPRGDGTFVLRPRLPESDLDSWVTPRRASELLGLANRTTIYDLLDPYEPFLVHKRPLRKRILISPKSIREFMKATNLPAFSTRHALQAEYKASVRTAMQALQGEPAKN